MDTTSTAAPAGPTAPAGSSPGPAVPPGPSVDGLGTEVRESVLLLLVSVLVTVGLAGAASALLTLLS